MNTLLPPGQPVVSISPRRPGLARSLARRAAAQLAAFLALATTGIANAAVFHPLPPLPGQFRQDSLQAISADGTTLGGLAASFTGFRPAVWNAQGQATLIGDSLVTGGVGALSADGTVALGRLQDNRVIPSDNFFRWTSATGLELLGTPAASSGAGAFSRDGTVMTGLAVYDPAVGNEVWRWRYGSGFTRLGRPAGYQYVSVTGCSADGSVLVGEAHNGGFTGHLIWRWSQADGFQSLDANAAGDTSPRVSGNGNVVAWYRGRYFARWSGGPSFDMLSVDPNQPAGIRPHGLSDDGQVVAGIISGTLNGISGEQVYRWTASQAGGVFELPGRPAGSSQMTSVSFPSPTSHPLWVSSDGQRLIGSAMYPSGARNRAWTWTPAGGFQVDDVHEIGAPNVGSADAGVLAWYANMNTSIVGVSRWSRDGNGVGQVTEVPALPEASVTRVSQLSADGTAAILTPDRVSPPPGAYFWRWTPGSGLLPLLSSRQGGWAPAQFMSANGSVLAGVTWGPEGGELWRWTESGGPETINLPPSVPANATLLSSDGSSVAFFLYDWDAGMVLGSSLWRRDSGFVDLGTLEVTSLSRDGRVAAGTALDGSGTRLTAWVWRQSDGSLDLLPAGYSPVGTVFISADGQVVGGLASELTTGNRRLYRWTRSGGFEWLGFLPGYQANNPTVQMMRISEDGSTLVGRGSSTGFGNLTDTWKWTQATGLQVQTLPPLAADSESEFPVDISEDGSVIFGAAVPGYVAWRWTASGVKHWVSDDLVPAANGWTEVGFYSGAQSGIRGVSSDGSVVAGSSRSPSFLSQGWLAAYRPVIERVTQADALPVTGDVPLNIYGVGFESGATAYLETTPRTQLTTTFDPSTRRLGAVIPGALLVGMGDFVTLQMTVVSPGGETCKSFTFPLVNSALTAIVGTVESKIAPTGEAVLAEVLPANSNSAGISATLDNTTGTSPASVTVATYTQNPTPTEAFDAGGGYVDVQVTGADSGDKLTTSFYYPSSLDAAAEAALVLMYFDGNNWITVQSSGPSAPVKDLENNRFIVTFDSTSVPAITALTGTVFGLADGAPTIVNPGAPAAPVALGITANLAIQYAASSAVTIAVDWGDGNTGGATLGGSGAASASRTYASTGVYTVTLIITDQEQRRTVYAHRYIVVYDPNGGFVTGGGWIQSPEGAYVANPGLTGKATFGFVSKYQKGKTVPTGDTEFHFQTAGFKFNSTVYEWLVVSGPLAQYKGSGTVNGAGNYGFLLTATDGQINGGGGVDKFRIKIWNKATGAIVYDNAMGSSDDINSANPRTIGGGSIVIQKVK